MGDGIVALFGALVAHEDYACDAVLRMQETVKRYAKGVPGDPWRGGG
jgi:class 3 adenylate cyclase